MVLHLTPEMDLMFKCGRGAEWVQNFVKIQLLSGISSAVLPTVTTVTIVIFGVFFLKDQLLKPCDYENLSLHFKRDFLTLMVAE